jgi:hypothetical protein
MSDRVATTEMSEVEFKTRLEFTLKSERQWLRAHRIQRAKYMARTLKSPEDRKLWDAVVKANAY